jgi:hypothetical protein
LSYAEPEQLAQALEIRVTDDNEDLLQDCLDAATDEIDAYFDWEPMPDPVPPVVIRTNVNRAVEWYKAPATYNGGVGFNDVGTLQAPGSGFERHALALQVVKVAGWGIA